ncbi:iron(III) transport system substrate-binding protein [Thiohalospira halophila DSM 15071]|uniref:Iron(III) transport system substrate-binding protein n=2 Tax=Thiohalospira halophila TaxID=381300 RepID=A0A1I1S940_9GAMM|nr:Fe(3+) ABC transporter substrate-binding protein [Thiohalospira halophila]SFD43024.1 iron(III) transport system substrate-binding protein [Thiohalospira halophila DSM 15071]
MPRLGYWMTALISAVLVAGCGGAGEEETLNVYSARKEALIKPLLDRFGQESGMEVKLLTADAGALLSRLENEGRNTPADVLITVDAGNLHRAREAGVLAATDSAVLESAIPAHLRDEQGHWFGLSQRARVIFTHADRVEEGAITSYEDLADPEWEGRVCIRSSDNVYNQSLVASMIAEHGEEETQAWAEGLVDNMARDPQGGDRDQIRAVAAEECDVAVANTYYYGAMQNGGTDDQEAAEAVRLVWPNQDDRGAHVNVSGGGVVAASQNRDRARALLEFLTTDESQQWYAKANNEFPVKAGVPAADTLAKWGDFQADDLPLTRLGELNARAVRLMDRAGWR